MPVKGPLTMQQSTWPSSAQMIGWAPGASESPEKEEGGPLGGRGPIEWVGVVKAKRRKSWERRKCSACLRPHCNVSQLCAK